MLDWEHKNDPGTLHCLLLWLIFIPRPASCWARSGSPAQRATRQKWAVTIPFMQVLYRFVLFFYFLPTHMQPGVCFKTDTALSITRGRVSWVFSSFWVQSDRGAEKHLEGGETGLDVGQDGQVQMAGRQAGRQGKGG